MPCSTAGEQTSLASVNLNPHDWKVFRGMSPASEDHSPTCRRTTGRVSTIGIKSRAGILDVCALHIFLRSKKEFDVGLSFHGVIWMWWRMHAHWDGDWPRCLPMWWRV